MNTKHHYSYEALMRYARRLGFGDIHTKLDVGTGLQTIIAIHNTRLGPAIGGCRFYPYRSADKALKDVLRLSYMMTLKAAASGLAHGGAKSVIIEPAKPYDREALFRSFGDFVHEMQGQYIVAMDIGTTTADMDVIASRTPYVIGAAGVDEMQADPSSYTARGVFRGIQAAVKFQLRRDDLDGLHIALEGAGKVAYGLSQLLHQHGVKITVSDINPKATQMLADQFGAHVVSSEKIYDVSADIFSPCAVGGTINRNTLDRFKVSIIAGAANNQLAHRKYGILAHQRGLLYIPDYIINSGGLIQAASVYDYHDIAIAEALIEKLYDRLLDLLIRATEFNQSTVEAAESMAWEKLNQIDKPNP